MLSNNHLCKLVFACRLIVIVMSCCHSGCDRGKARPIANAPFSAQTIAAVANVSKLALAKDEDLLVVASTEGVIQLWHEGYLKPHAVFNERPFIKDIALSHDAAQIALVGGGD